MKAGDAKPTWSTSINRSTSILRQFGSDRPQLVEPSVTAFPEGGWT